MPEFNGCTIAQLSAETLLQCEAVHFQEDNYFLRSETCDKAKYNMEV